MHLRQEFDSIVREYGPWTAHNLEIDQGLHTITDDVYNRAAERAELFWYLYSEFVSSSVWRKLIRKRPKVLDLGCLEGGIAIKIAAHGADVTGIDVRRGHLVKADFAARCLGLEKRCTWMEGDVTDPMLWRKLDQYDLIICSGLLYHLDSDQILPLLERIRNQSRRSSFLIIDTNVADSPSETRTYESGLVVHGMSWHEHQEDATVEQRILEPWSSFKNNNAFWLTERSLINTLISAGFKTVFKPLYPYHEWGHQSRDVWCCINTRSSLPPLGLPMRNDPDLRPIRHPGFQQ